MELRKNKINDISDAVRWDEEKLKRIIIDGDVKFMNEFCFAVGEYYAKSKLTTSQIRNIFDEIQNMTSYDEKKLQLLRPKLAYVAGRHASKTKVIKEHLQPMLDASIKITNKDTFENFKNFLEAIVAYHRYHGGKE
ncbi:MAG: type III-A CRISPR-associated protein Csm2 [bacterium]|nr:type III-A CRISPR-associated protein Csm2 [bacterium]